jgi:hypothetical protein
MELQNQIFKIKEKINILWWWSVEETKTVTDNKQDTTNRLLTSLKMMILQKIGYKCYRRQYMYNVWYQYEYNKTEKRSWRSIQGAT